MTRRERGRPPHPGILTPAEQRVLEELRRGGTNAEIAERLGVTLDTVKFHISNMLGKLGLDNRRQLAAWRPEPQRRLFGLLALPGTLDPIGRVLVWAGVAVAGAAAVAVVAVVLIVLASLDGSAQPLALAPTATATATTSCESGIAVPNPGANAELVEDCEALLGLRDTLAGDAALNWAAGRPMTDWTGVTVGGAPQRVTALSLANSGLTGELSGLVGNLAGLAELRLNGNSLTGLIPSKLAQLTNLTHVSISGTAFTGCAPPVLRRVATNDVAGSGLADCGAPTDISDYTGNEVLTAATYQFIWKEGDPPLIFDVPEGLRMRVDGAFASDGDGPPIKGLILEDAATGQSWIGLDVRRGVVYGLHVVEPSRAPRSATASTPSIATLFGRLGESLWIGSTAE